MVSCKNLAYTGSGVAVVGGVIVGVRTLSPAYQNDNSTTGAIIMGIGVVALVGGLGIVATSLARQGCDGESA